MSQLSSITKHHILLEYQSHSATHNFQSLSRRHSIKGGERTIRNWINKWDGTPQSLERKKGSGRHRLLTRTQVYRCISQPIIRKNRRHRPIHYTQLLLSVREKTHHTDISLRTIQREGKQLKVKMGRGIKRTAVESTYVHPH